MKRKHKSEVGVFISYIDEDRFIADTLAAKLLRVGFRPWIDFTAIKGGDEWKKQIEDALSQSAALLVVLTQESVKSDWVHYEVKRALEMERIVIPLMMQTCVPPAALESLHYVDFRHDSESAFVNLQQALLQAIVRQGSTIEDTTEKTTGFYDILNNSKNRVKIEQVHTPLALVIEDVQDTRDVLRDLLIEMGLDVHVAANRGEATDCIQNHTYQFITLDMMLGPDDTLGQQGLAMLDLLKRYQNGVPVIIITSRAWEMTETAEFFATYRIKHLLKKPVDWSKLRNLVEEHVWRL